MPSSEEMMGNTRAEKWTLEKAEELFAQAIEITKGNEYDFIGEVAKELGTYIDVFDYLADKFPTLKEAKNQLKRNCEASCFSNGKNNKINVAMAIVNLKSNHGWTDRSHEVVEQTTIKVAPKNAD